MKRFNYLTLDREQKGRKERMLFSSHRYSPFWLAHYSSFPPPHTMGNMCLPFLRSLFTNSNQIPTPNTRRFYTPSSYSRRPSKLSFSNIEDKRSVHSSPGGRKAPSELSGFFGAPEMTSEMEQGHRTWHHT